MVAGIVGAILPGTLAHLVTGTELLSAWTVTAPPMFAIATVVLLYSLGKVREPVFLVCLTIAVSGLTFGFCDLTVRLGGLVVRWMLRAPDLPSAPSFAALVAEHYATNGAAFLLIAVGIGAGVGVLWSKLIESEAY